MLQLKQIIPVILMIATIGAVVFVPQQGTTHPGSTTNDSSPLSVSGYQFTFTNFSLDLTAQTSKPAYLYLSVTTPNQTVINTTSVLSTTLKYSFYYTNTTFLLSAGVTTSLSDPMNIDYFLTNKTIFQPLPFQVTQKTNQFLNKTVITLFSSMNLNLQLSSANNKSLTFINKTTDSFVYSYTEPGNATHLFLEDMYNRTITKDLQFGSIATPPNQTALDFTYSYQIVHKTSLILTINATLPCSANVSLTNTTDTLFKQSVVNAEQQQFNFDNLSFTTYTVNMTILTINNSLSKVTTIAINDTTPPKLLTYSINTGITYISTSFTYSKVALTDYYLTYQNGSIRTTLGSSYTSAIGKSFWVPIGVYNLTIGLTDKFNNHNEYSFSFIRTAQITSNSYLVVRSNTSVITDQTSHIDIYPEVYYNNSIHTSLNDTLSISMSIQNVTLGSYAIPYTTASLLDIPQSYLSLYPTSELVVNYVLPLYNLSYQQSIMYISTKHTTIPAPAITLQSYVSNVTAGQTFALHLISQYPINASVAYLDIFSSNTNYSIQYTQVLITGGTLDSDFFLSLPFSNASNDTLRVTVYFEKNYIPIIAYIRLELTYGVDTTAPVLLNQSVTSLNNIVMLSLNTSEPAVVEIVHGISKSLLTATVVNTNYQTEFTINMSDILDQNSLNYYYLVLIDSGGNKLVYDNSSNFYSLFMPKLDFQIPYNTTTITIDQNGVVKFTTNELVNVTIICQDDGGLYGQFSCGGSSVFNTSFQLQLQFPLGGIRYIVLEVVITDKAGNQAIISLDLPYQT